VLIKNAGRIEVPVRGIGLRHTKTTSVPLCSGEFFLLLLICLYAAPFHLDRGGAGGGTAPPPPPPPQMRRREIAAIFDIFIFLILKCLRNTA